MKKARAILCGVLAALMLAGCGGSGIGKYAVAEAGTPTQTRKTEDRVDTETLRQFSDETAAAVFTGERNEVYSPLSLYAALGMLTELTEGQTKQQVMDLLGVSGNEELRQWTQTLWRQLYRDEKDSALWLGNAAFLNENMTFHKEPLDVLAKSYYASSYQVPMGSKAANQAIAKWLNEQTNDLLADDTGAIKTKERDLLRLYNTLYYKAAWQTEFFEGVTVEELLQRKNILGEPLAVDEWEVRVNWSVPKFDLHDSLKLNDVLQTLGVTDAFDVSKADFSPLADQEQPVYVESVNQAARVKVDERGVEAAAYTEVEVADGDPMPRELPEEEMDLNRPFVFVLEQDGVPLFVGVIQTMEGM